MNITPISTFKIQTNNKNTPIKKNIFNNQFYLKKDSFQRNTQISNFKGNYNNNIIPKEIPITRSLDDTNHNESTEDFLLYAQKTDFLAKIPEITVFANYIGKGFEGTVYKIPQEPRWVIKESNRVFSNIYNIDKKIIPLTDKMPLINVGQPVAIIQIGHGPALLSYQILKTQHGTEYGIAPSPISPDYFLKSKSAQSIYKHSIQQMANLPISSYESLIDDLSYINSCGYKPDYFNPNNFLIDGININMVDTEEITDPNYQNDFGNVLYTLLIGEFFHYSQKQLQTDPSDEIQELNLQIITKFMTVMKNRGKKFSQDNYHFQKFLKSNLSSPYFKTDDYDKKIEILKQNNLL